MSSINKPNIESWIEVQKNSDFPIQNIPFGVLRKKNGKIRCATRIGNYVADLYEMANLGYFNDLGIENPTIFNEPSLNNFIGLGKPACRAVRKRISELFEKGNPIIRDNIAAKSQILSHIGDVQMMMPVMVGDYTDFYSSLEHATNVGKMFRDPEKALLPNWRHIPVGYHGRSSSIVVSGTDIHRPKGQTIKDDSVLPEFGPSRLVDFELEMAFITGKSTQLGESIPVGKAEDFIFGVVLFNDLSARDIQKWEYVPLGPFLSKNFGSVVSPWIVTLDALESFRVNGPHQNPLVLPYLRFAGKRNFDINLEVLIQPEGSKSERICKSNFKYMYWNMSQQLAHQTVNGCNINVGDMYGSGTISGPSPDSFGSLLELTWNGTKPIKLSDGTERKFIEDNDTVILQGWAEKDGVRIGFGECVTKILPAKK